ncbi:MAG TPA: thioredoxin family protein [Terriglobales bacterium]
MDRKDQGMMYRSSRIAVIACLLWVSAYIPVSAQTKSTNTGRTPSKTQPAGATFAPVEEWKAAVVSGDAAKLRALYSASPAARVVLSSGETSAETDVAFWIGLKAKRIKLDVAQSGSPQQDLQQVAFEAEVLSAADGKLRTVYVIDGQLWQKQGDQWRIAATKRSDVSRLQQPLSTDKEIYLPGLNAHVEIADALKKASQQRKRVLLVFGANWCYDCHVLDLAFHRPDVTAVLNPNFVVVHVDVGQGDKNQDIMKQYQVPMAKGIPAIAVLDSDGKLLYSQQGGEFEKARALAPEDVLAFLNKWKPKGSG